MIYLEPLITWFSDRTNVTFLIAIVGFAISIYNFISGIVQNMVRVNIEINNAFRAEDDLSCVDIVHLKIINNSRMPITFTKVVLSNHLGEFRLGGRRCEVLNITRRVGKEVKGTNTWFSDRLPIRIEGNDYANLLLVADEEVPAITRTGPNTFRFYTSKKVIRKEALISDFTDYNKIRECHDPI